MVKPGDGEAPHASPSPGLTITRFAFDQNQKLRDIDFYGKVYEKVINPLPETLQKLMDLHAVKEIHTHFTPSSRWS